MRNDIETALDQCLVGLRGGMDIESCLQQYPAYAEELWPLLQLVTHVGRVIAPASSAVARQAGQEKMLAAAARKREREAAAVPVFRAIRRAVRGFAPPRPQGLTGAWQVMAALLLVVLVAAGGATARASASSLPGDMLYPLKLASQRAQVALTFDDVRQHGLEVRFETQKRLDVQAVLKGGRQTSVEFQGVLQSMEGDTWVVGDLQVTLDDSTKIVGQPRLGALVLVRGSLPGSGELLASWLRVEPGIPQEPSQSPTATETVAPSETPEPTDTLQPSDTPQPTEAAEPTETPEPRSTPEAAETDEPDETPEASGTREHEATSEPTDTPEAENTPEPGGEPEPTETPEPEDTPEPGGEPDPTEAPEPEDTPEPGGEPDPTEAPEPEDTREPGDEPEPTEAPEPEDTAEPRETTEPANDPEPEETPEDDEPEEDPSEDPEPDETPGDDKPEEPAEEPAD